METVTGDRPRILGLRRAGPDSWVTTAVGLWIVTGIACTIAWSLAGAPGRWPVWVWFGVGAPVAAGAALRAAWRVSPGPARWAAAHAGLAVVTSTALAVIWWLTGAGDWLWWSLLGIGVAFTVHALLAFADQLPPRPRERALTARVDELQRSRRGAIGARDAELRRLERNLHDGAQSRLVALGMLLARAEARLDPDSEPADLLRRARSEVGAAVGELRSLGQGLAPPLLSERGLVPAVEALALRSPVRVRVVADVPGRPQAEVETAAYFVVAEALTNVMKHAGGASAEVELRVGDGRLCVAVIDDGAGGADPDGSGLEGLKHRVEALDGRLEVVSEPGEGTTVKAELPCAS